MTDLEIDEYQDLVDGEFHHFCVYKSAGLSRPIKGFGSASTRELALTKAMSEFAERVAYFRVGAEGRARTSNGFACHPDKVEAIKRAAFELFERDLVMVHWLEKRAPQWLTKKEIEQSNHQCELNSFSKKGFELEFGLLGEYGNAKILVSVLRSQVRNFGFSFASTACEMIDSGIRSLISDQRRAATIIMSREMHGDSFSCKLKQNELLTPQDHRDFYFDPVNASKCSWFFEAGRAVWYEQPEVNIELLKSIVELPWPHTVAHATSSSLQNYFVGMPSESKLNQQRLGRVEVGRLNTAPHPLA